MWEAVPSKLANDKLELVPSSPVKRELTKSICQVAIDILSLHVADYVVERNFKYILHLL